MAEEDSRDGLEDVEETVYDQGDEAQSLPFKMH
jgi:hypothetical protein